MRRLLGAGVGLRLLPLAHDAAVVSLPRLLALIAYLLIQPTTELLGRVVSDGDTIDVPDDAKTTNRIRLAGIDAPEPAQPFSRQHLSECCTGRDVTVRVLGEDRYGGSRATSRWMAMTPARRSSGPASLALPSIRPEPRAR